jgi:hypothetical protein
MATSKGQVTASGMAGTKARGYAPMGHGPHGGHHRKHFDKIAVNPMADHMRNNPGARHSIDQPPHAGTVSG